MSWGTNTGGRICKILHTPKVSTNTRFQFNLTTSISNELTYIENWLVLPYTVLCIASAQS